MAHLGIFTNTLQDFARKNSGFGSWCYHNGCRIAHGYPDFSAAAVDKRIIIEWTLLDKKSQQDWIKHEKKSRSINVCCYQE